MKILFVNAYFYPENIAFSHLEADIMEGLIAAGHQITVVCPTPCRGIGDDTIRKYKRRKNESRNGIRIRRYWAPREGNHPVLRAFRYFWCNLRGNLTARRFCDADVIFAVSTPPTQGYFVGKLAKRHGIPMVYSLQDLFPDSLVTAGMTTDDSLLYRLGERIEKKTYALSAAIIVLSDTVRKTLSDRGVDEAGLITVNNWIDTDAVRPIPREENALFDEYHMDRSRFTVVYAGNLGASQGTGVILEAAKLLRDNREINFVIFGAGADYEKACSEAEQYPLDNVRIHPLLPVERVSEVYSMGDVSLITCKKGAGETAMPSKLWSIMACETQIIASFDTDSELSEVLRTAGAGVCVEPGDPTALKEAIESAYRNRNVTRKSAARDYVKKHAAKSACVQKYVDCMEKQCKLKPAE